MNRRYLLLLSYVLSLCLFVVSVVVASNVASWGVNGYIHVTTPTLNLKLANNPDMSAPCTSISFSVVRGNQTSMQTKWLRNMGDRALNASYVAVIPQGFNLTIYWYRVALVNGQWFPDEPHVHVWRAGETVALAVNEVILLNLNLSMDSNVQDGSYSFSLTFNGSA